MQLSKLHFYLALQVLYIVYVLLYQCLWIFSKKTTADITAFGSLTSNYTTDDNPDNRLSFRYTTADGKTYTMHTTRNELSDTVNTIAIEYSYIVPGYARIDNFYGKWAGFCIFYFIYFAFTSLLLMMPNAIIPRKAQFIVSKHWPFIAYVEIKPLP